MALDIIGQGWAFPPKIDRQGRIAVARGDSEIVQAIEIILRTSPGQRVMRPEFGSRLHELVFAPNSAETANAARGFVEDALAMWEPRIEVRSVNTAPHEEEENVIVITIEYEIKVTHDRRSLVLPFYLIPDE